MAMTAYNVPVKSESTSPPLLPSLPNPLHFLSRPYRDIKSQLGGEAAFKWVGVKVLKKTGSNLTWLSIWLSTK